MNSRFPLIVVVLLSVAGCARQHPTDAAVSNMESVAVRDYPEPLPTSLDRLYPPAAEAPVYTIKMHELAAPLGGLVVNLTEEDFENVGKQFALFRAAYEDVAGLVPEWGDLFPGAPIDDLGSAIDAGDRNAIMGALHDVDAVCHDCHVDYMPSVQQKYHWPQFAKISVTDPVTGEDLNVAGYMRALEMSFGGVMISLQEGQQDRARRYSRELASRFDGLADLCIDCHDTERTYFIDEGVRRLVSAFGSEVEKESPDAARLGQLAQQIGTESCFRCHLVHVPAALAQSLRDR